MRVYLPCLLSAMKAKAVIFKSPVRLIKAPDGLRTDVNRPASIDYKVCIGADDMVRIDSGLCTGCANNAARSVP